MDKDPDEATVISPGSGRDFSGEKEHLVLGGRSPGNGISSGMLMAMRRLDAAEAGGSSQEARWLPGCSPGSDREQLRD
jgi:hypothetical protein